MNDNPSRLEDPRKVLGRHGLRPKRGLSQSFLVNLAVVERIADATAALEAERVIEIGAGAGTLTTALAARFHRVVAIERDRQLVELLRAELGELPGVDVVEADATTFDLAAASSGESTAIAGNLPYHVTGLLLRRIVGARGTIAGAVVMVQREVADRLVAPPGGRAYGALSVMTQAFMEVLTLFRVSPGSFHPPPKVASTVLCLRPLQTPRVGDLSEQSLSTLVRAAFGARRKTLRNSLGAAFDADAVAEALAQEDIDPSLRAERLSVEQLGALATRLVE